MCSHAGIAQPTSVNPNVLVSGMPVVVISNTYVIAGCSLATVPSPPCITGAWLAAATHVFVGGQPVVLMSSASICTPTGTPMQILSTQTQVTAT